MCNPVTLDYIDEKQLQSFQLIAIDWRLNVVGWGMLSSIYIHCYVYSFRRSIQTFCSYRNYIVSQWHVLQGIIHPDKDSGLFFWFCHEKLNSKQIQCPPFYFIKILSLHSYSIFSINTDTQLNFLKLVYFQSFVYEYLYSCMYYNICMHACDKSADVQFTSIIMRMLIIPCHGMRCRWTKLFWIPASFPPHCLHTPMSITLVVKKYIYRRSDLSQFLHRSFINWKPVSPPAGVWMLAAAGFRTQQRRAASCSCPADV